MRMKNPFDNAIALLILIASNEIVASTILWGTHASERWWLIAQLPVIIMAMVTLAITAGSQTKGE